MTVSVEVLDKLAKFDTPTICNVIELFDIRPRNTGYMDERIKCNFSELPPMVGFAATASFRSDAPPVGGDAYGSIQAQLEQFEGLPGPPVVVIQDLDDPAAAAVFGEVMCSTYQAFGARGLVTNGAGRDLEQVREIGFPVFTGSTMCSHGYCHLLHIGLPVRMGRLTIQDGELLHGDANGVTTVPAEIASEIADVSAEFLDAESIMLDYVKAEGPKERPRFNELREEFQNVVAKLRERIHS
jgi:4-hydroxy-4-methyl-2-oxoglutarate aldolase